MSAPDLIREHVEECCFLWHQRRIAVFQPNLGLAGLARLDERLEAHLDGVRVAGAEGLAALIPLVPGEAGAAWAATILAAESGQLARLDSLLKGPAAETAAEAIAWMDASAAENAMAHWSATGGSSLAVAARAAGFRGSAEPRLAAWAAASDPFVAAAALCSALRLGIAPVLTSARQRAGDSDHAVAQAAHLILALSGATDSAEALLRALAPVREWSLPLIIAARCAAPGRDAPGWLGCVLAGASGSSTRLPALLAAMDDPRLARCAGEAVATITGVDLRAEALIRPAPPDAVHGPSEDPADADVGLHPDADLPWPDAAAVRAWSQRQPPAPAGRLLCGRPVAEAAAVLTADNQRLRWAAAVELARSGERRLFPVDAPAAQQRLLGAGT